MRIWETYMFVRWLYAAWREGAFVPDREQMVPLDQYIEVVDHFKDANMKLVHANSVLWAQIQQVGAWGPVPMPTQEGVLQDPSMPLQPEPTGDEPVFMDRDDLDRCIIEYQLWTGNHAADPATLTMFRNYALVWKDGGSLIRQ